MYQFLAKNTVQHPKVLRLCDALSPTSKGVTLALISTALFTIVGVFVRKLTADYDTFQVLFFRQLVFMLMLPLQLLRIWIYCLSRIKSLSTY